MILLYMTIYLIYKILIYVHTYITYVVSMDNRQCRQWSIIQLTMIIKTFWLRNAVIDQSNSSIPVSRVLIFKVETE